MDKPQTFASQLIADKAYIVTLIILTLVILASISAYGYDLGMGNGNLLFGIAGAIAAVLLGNIIFQPEMRAKRGLPPFQW